MKRLYMMALMSLLVVPQLFSADRTIFPRFTGIMIAGFGGLMLLDGMFMNGPDIVKCEEIDNPSYRTVDRSRSLSAGAVAGLMMATAYSCPNLELQALCAAPTITYTALSTVMYVWNLFRFVGKQTDKQKVEANYLLKRGLFWSSAVALGIAGGSLIAPKLFAKK